MGGPLRILEVGGNILLKFGAPEQVEQFWCGLKPYGWGHPDRPLGPLTMFRCLRGLRQGGYDLVVIHPNLYPVWHPRASLTIIRSWPLSFPKRLFAAWSLWLFRFVKSVPIAVVDEADSFGIDRHNFFLLRLARYVFKRELPADRWQVFYRTGHRRLPTRTFRRKRRYQAYLSKLRPIGIGFWWPKGREAESRREKTTDVFFAGQVEHTSTVRSDGLTELLSLRSEGVRIDTVEGRQISHEEYRDRCAAAWLVWSPSGFGWECFRHYEAARAGSVPVINYPTLERYRPLDHGVHCFFYSVESGGLSRVIRQALPDKDRLRRMAAAGAEFVRRHHTHRALADYVTTTTLGRHLDGSPARTAHEQEDPPAGA